MGSDRHTVLLAIQTERHTVSHVETQTDIQTERHTVSHVETQTDIQTERHTVSHVETQTDQNVYIYLYIGFTPSTTPELNLGLTYLAITTCIL